MSAAKVIPLAPLRLAISMRKVSRCCVYSTHPYTGSDCRNPHGWKAHGGPLFSPWAPGHILRVVEVIKARGRREVLRTFGVGIRALQAELRVRS